MLCVTMALLYFRLSAIGHLLLAEAEDEPQPPAIAPASPPAPRPRMRQRIYRSRINLLGMPATEVLQTYRFDIQTILYIVELLLLDIQPVRDISTTIPPLLKVLVTLHFLASGSFQRVSGRANGLSQACVCRTIKVVLAALLKHSSEFVHFPLTLQELTDTKRGFYRLARMSNVIGCIDGTHVRIVPPRAAEEINRKCTHSINVQVVCNADLAITHCCAEYPGSTHDAFILRNSFLPDVIAALPSRSGWLLGDSAYGLRPWLMTPCRNPASPAEARYNAAHIKTRNTVERAIGVLKSRFRCLDRTGGDLLYRPAKVCQLFVACCVLHNIALQRRVDLLEVPRLDPPHPTHAIPATPPSQSDLVAGKALRARLISDYFGDDEE